LNLLSDNKLTSNLSDISGIGVFAQEDIKENDIIMTFNHTQTISSFDNYFPYLKVAKEIIEFEKYSNLTSLEHQIYFMTLNLNYLRFSNKDVDRFLKVFFMNLPIEYEFVPTWEPYEKELLMKITGETPQFNSFFGFNGESFEKLNADVKSKIRGSIIEIERTLKKDNIRQMLDLIHSRGIKISLKNWKILKGLKVENGDGKYYYY